MKKKLLACIGVISVSSFILATSLTFSWFDNRVKFTPNITGSAIGSYFNQYDDATTGTWGKSSTNPYVISTARQLYNLSWLQYLGNFNSDSDSDSLLDTYYFEIDKNLTYDLDMSGWTIPAIGDTSNPFIGNFNGNSKVISNLTISNSFSDFNAHPYSVTSSNYTSSSIIGLFGVVGQYESTSISYDYTVNKITNVYVDSLTVKNNSSSNVLAGFLAGYVNASIQYCGVGYAHFDFKSGTTNISSLSDNVSNYTLIGYYNSDDYTWTDRPGSSNGFGGSIDFASLSKRLTYINFSNTSNSTFNLSMNNTSYDWTSTSNLQANLQTGTYLPLNIDLAQATIKNYDSSLTMGSYYDSATSEPILSTNTGYIVGRDTGGNAGPRIRNQKSNKDSQGIKYCFKPFDSGEKVTERDQITNPANYSMLYYDSINKTSYRIKDDDNKNTEFSTITNTKDVNELNFVGYDNVKANYISMINEDTTDSVLSSGKINLTALYFYYRNSWTSFESGSLNNVILNGTTYNTYQFYKGGINFSIKTSGYVSCIAINFLSSYKAAFNRIYKVNRDDNGNITSSEQISTIYSNGADVSYTAVDGYSKLIDLSYLSTNAILENYQVYYFEIPLLKGDYFMCGPSVSSSYAAPFIFYLDIGANATGSEEGKEIKDVDFVYQENDKLVAITDDNWDTYKSDILFSISGTESGDGLYYFRRVKGVGVLYYVGTANLTLSSIGSGSYGVGKDKYCTETAS